MHDQNRQPAPDYTTAAMAAVSANLLWIFFVIWFFLGLVPVILLAFLINHVINRIAYFRRAEVSLWQ